MDALVIYIRMNPRSSSLEFRKAGVDGAIPVSANRMDSLSVISSHPMLVNPGCAVATIDGRLKVFDLSTRSVESVNGFNNVKNIVRSNDSDSVIFIDSKSMIQYKISENKSKVLADLSDLVTKLVQWYSSQPGQQIRAETDLGYYDLYLDTKKRKIFFTDSVFNRRIFSYEIESGDLRYLERGLNPQVIQISKSTERVFFLASKRDQKQPGVGYFDLENTNNGGMLYSGKVNSFRRLSDSVSFLVLVSTDNFLSQPRILGYSLLVDGELIRMSESVTPDDLILAP